MAFQRTRPPGNSLDDLLAFIHQEEDASNALLQVVAGKQGDQPFNLVEFAFTPLELPPVSFTPVTTPIDTAEQQLAVQTQIEAGGKTVLFFAPLFDASASPKFDPSTAKMIAVCRDGPMPPVNPVGGLSLALPIPGKPTGVVVQSSTPIAPDKTSGSFKGNSSETSGLSGTETTFADGTVVRDGTETLKATRDGKNLGSKSVRQVITKKNGVQLVQQADYCWQQRALPDAVLADHVDGFPAGTAARKGKATEFGKHDKEDEGTGSPLLKVTQTNSEVFGCSLKQSILTEIFGTPLSKKADLLRAQVEIFNPSNGRFARVPLVDVGPAEKLEAVIDLTFALDRFLGTKGSAQVQFRVVV
jgi:hypothetical protein